MRNKSEIWKYKSSLDTFLSVNIRQKPQVIVPLTLERRSRPQPLLFVFQDECTVFKSCPVGEGGMKNDLFSGRNLKQTEDTGVGV